MVMVYFSFYAATYDTQEVQLTVQNDSDISILCIFAKGSTPKGCYILVFNRTVVVSGTVATAEKSPVEMSFNSAKYLVPNLTMGTYSILVFDVESDGSFNPSQRPAFSAVVNVTGKLATTETTGTNSQNTTHTLYQFYIDYTLHKAILSTSNFCCRYTCWTTVWCNSKR